MRIEYLFCDNPKKIQGREALGYCQKVTGQTAYLATRHEKTAALTGHWYELDGGDKIPDEKPGLGKPFFVICFWEPGWNALSEKQKVAAADHELCHAGLVEDEETGEITLTMVPHDIQEFNCIAERHGLWHTDIVALMAALKRGPQLTFDEIAYRPAVTSERIAVRMNKVGHG